MIMPMDPAVAMAAAPAVTTVVGELLVVVALEAA
jgi:hypothetical protein